ncbi:hypothetical protein AB0N05_14520 [Nocardia sp. NPDC051030]|uniref:hypothetical protein n=1 Tax=Nocardia sp. NPDC051030 TaxID=3155162 RepID=UPI00343E8F94
MSEDLKVDPAVLKQAEAGITAIIGDLSDLGVKETGSMGRGFALLALSPLQAGKASVQSAFETFCERWSWGVRSLVQAANSMAQSVGLAAGRYHMMDQANENTLKEVYSHLFSDPTLTKEKIDERSWGATFADNGFNALMHPDYSGQSFQDMVYKMNTDAQVIKAVGPQALANGQAVMSSPNEGMGWNTGAAQQAAQIMQERNPGVEGAGR